MGETDLDKMLNTLKPILRPGTYVYTSLRLESSRFHNTIEPIPNCKIGTWTEDILWRPNSNL